MKQRIVFLLLIFSFAFITYGCNDNNSAKNTPELLAIEAPEISTIKEDTPKYINSIFYSPPPIEGHDNDWAFNPTDIFSFYMDWNENSQVLRKAHVSVFCPGFFGYREETRHMDENTIHELLDMGIRMVDWLSTYDLQEEPIGDLEYVADALCEDIDGNKIIFQLMGWPMQCTNNPEWQKYLTDAAVYVSGLDTCGTAADEWLGTAGALGSNGCFCDYCMEGFRKYLKEKYTANELLQMGIDNIETFNYGDYIIQNCYDKYLDNRFETPFFNDYRLYQLDSIVDFYSGVNEKIKETATNSHSDGYFSANMAGLMTDYFAIAGVVDYMAPEVRYSYPPDNITTMLYRLSASMNKPLYGAPNCFENTEMMLDEGISEIMKIYTAQAYSNQGYISVPYNFNVFLEVAGDISTLTKPDMETLYSYYDYIYNNHMLFDGLVSQSDIGLMYSYASEKYYTYPARDCFFAVGDSLLDAGYDFDVVFTGDNDLIADTFDIETLSKYKVIIMPGVASINNHEEQIILEYIENGGKVLSINNTASKYANDNPREETSVLNLDRYAEIPMGDGIYVHISDLKFSLGTEGGYSSISTQERDKIIAEVNKIYSKGMVWEDEEFLDLKKYFSTRVNGYVIHAVNYSFDNDLKNINQLQDIGISIIDDTPFTSDTLGVYYITPESADLIPLEFIISEGYINFELPSIYAWGTIIVGERARIEAMKMIDNTYASLNFTFDDIPEESQGLLDNALLSLISSNYEEAISFCLEAGTLPLKTDADRDLLEGSKIVEFLQSHDMNSEQAQKDLDAAKSMYEKGKYKQAIIAANSIIDKYSVRIIDGKLDDWFFSEPVAIDPIGDANMPGCDIGRVYMKIIGEVLYIAAEVDTENPFVQYRIRVGENDFNINCQGYPPEFFFFIDDKRIDELPSNMTVALGECMECSLPISIFNGEEIIHISINSSLNNFPDFTYSDEIDEVIEILIE